MRENHFVITLSPELVVTKEEGKLRRNADGSQFISVITDDWLPNEGEILYITFSREDDETEQLVKVGPLQLFYNVDKHRFITLAPPDLIRFAGQWDYSIELRFNISEDKNDEIAYDCLTSSVESLTVIDSIASATKTDTFTKETELISAARELATALAVGYTAQDVMDAASNAEANKNSALESAQSASESARSAASSEANAKASAAATANDRQEAEQQATNAEESARQAKESETVATEQANKTTNYANEASVSALEAERYAEGAKEACTEASDWAEIAKQYAQFGIKLNTEYKSVAELPSPGNPQYIYLIPNGGSGNNSYDEYMWIDNKKDYEKIGTTEVDLADYATLEGLSKEEKARTSADEDLDERINQVQSDLDLMSRNVSTLLANKANIHGTYEGMTVGNATNATNADSATKATQDGNGSNIANTYAKQSGTYSNLTAGKANALSNSRLIEGFSFNGTANVICYGTCSTPSVTLRKDVTLLSGQSFTLTTGARIIVFFTAQNTAQNPTLKVGDTVSAYINAPATEGAGYTPTWKALSAVEFVYDGVYWRMVSNQAALSISNGNANSNQRDYVERYYLASDGSSWYRVWASGWKEMGGNIENIASATAVRPISFPISFESTNYTFIANVIRNSTSSTAFSLGIDTKYKSYINVRPTYVGASTSGNASEGWSWYACGY